MTTTKTKPTDGEIRHVYGFSTLHPELLKIRYVYHANRSYEEVTGIKKKPSVKPFVDQWGVYEQHGRDEWRLIGRATTEDAELFMSGEIPQRYGSYGAALAALRQWCQGVVDVKAGELRRAREQLEAAIILPDVEEA